MLYWFPKIKNLDMNCNFAKGHLGVCPHQKIGDDSWHPSDCPNCPEKLRKQMQIYEGEG
jgi:hypothetical protein